MKRTHGVPIAMSLGRDYFDGCHNRAIFEDAPYVAEVGPLTPTPNLTLADAVHAAEVRRSDSGQLGLPAEFLPTPAGQLFA